METSNIDILIQRYIDGDLNATEKAAFETRMSTDTEIQKSVADYLLLKKGVETFAIAQIKIDLQKAHQNITKAKSFNNYKPSMNGGGGFNIFSFLVKTILLATVTSVVLIYIGKMPLENEYIQEVNKKLHSYDSLFIIKQDTIWTTIKTKHVVKGDTILIRNKEELKQWEEHIKKIEKKAIPEPIEKKIPSQSEETDEEISEE